MFQQKPMQPSPLRSRQQQCRLMGYYPLRVRLRETARHLCRDPKWVTLIPMRPLTRRWCDAIAAGVIPNGRRAVSCKRTLTVLISKTI